MRSSAVPLVRRRWLVGVGTVLLALFASIWMAANQANAASSTPTVYIVTGENFPDALGVGPASALARGPILMVSKNSIPGPTAAELSRLQPDRIFVIGGTAVISSQVEQQLRNWAPVTRIGGRDRYETTAMVSQAGFPAPTLLAPVQAFEAYETWENPHRGNGFALEVSVPVSSPSWIVVSGQAAFDSDLSSPTDMLSCGITNGTDPKLAAEGSWRYPSITEYNLRPTCATQTRYAAAPGNYTIRLVTTDMQSTTYVTDRSLMVTVIPVFDTEFSASSLPDNPDEVPPQPIPSD